MKSERYGSRQTGFQNDRYNEILDRKDKALIFDLDGILWDTRKPVVRIWNDVFEEKGHGRPLTFELLTSLMGKPMSAFGEAIFPQLDPDQRDGLVRQSSRRTDAF